MCSPLLQVSLISDFFNIKGTFSSSLFSVICVVFIHYEAHVDANVIYMNVLVTSHFNNIVTPAIVSYIPPVYNSKAVHVLKLILIRVCGKYITLIREYDAYVNYCTIKVIPRS